METDETTAVLVEGEETAVMVLIFNIKRKVSNYAKPTLNNNRISTIFSEPHQDGQTEPERRQDRDGHWYTWNQFLDFYHTQPHKALSEWNNAIKTPFPPSCTYHLRGHCQKGAACQYSHGDQTMGEPIGKNF